MQTGRAATRRGVDARLQGRPQLEAQDRGHTRQVRRGARRAQLELVVAKTKLFFFFFFRIFLCKNY